MPGLHLKVALVSGKEEVLPEIDTTSTLKELMHQINVITGVPEFLQVILQGHGEISLSDTNVPLTSVGIHDGTRLSLVRMSFPQGVYEFKSSQNRDVNGFFGVGFGISFQESERMQAEFSLDGGVAIHFQGEYDTGFQIVELRGVLQACSLDETCKAFQACLHRKGGNWHRREDETEACNVAVTFSDDGFTVVLTPETTTAVMPFTDRAWELQRIAKSPAGSEEISLSTSGLP